MSAPDVVSYADIKTALDFGGYSLIRYNVEFKNDTGLCETKTVPARELERELALLAERFINAIRAAQGKSEIELTVRVKS